MAAFVSAKRWGAQLNTHKTKEGRMLCTGIGCVGCFPELYQKEARELGICDVEEPVYTLRPWLNDKGPNNKSKGSTIKRAPRKKTSKAKGQAKAKQEGDKAVSKEPSCDEIKLTSADTDIPDSSKCVDATQTKDSMPQIENASLDKTRELHSIDKQFLKEMTDYESDKDTRANSNLGKISSGTGFRVRLAGELYDNMYIGRERNVALSLQDDCLPSRPFSNHDDSEQVFNGEDAVCFFFALEYFHSARDLPVFKVMEIVESLSQTVNLADIKCIQRMNECWRIVLRSRKYTRFLRESGIRIRGRKYEVIEDRDSYFDVVYK